MGARKLIQWYYELGFNLIPIPKGEKGALISWKQYQETKAPKISDDYEGNIAVVLGKTSGNLVDVDCDTKELLDMCVKILPETMTTRSYRGGHLYYQADYPIRKFTLDLGAYGKLEVGGQGQISILPPSLHKEGIRYEFLKQRSPAKWHGDFKEELTEAFERELGIEVIRERIDVKKILQGVSAGIRDESAIRLSTWFRRQGLTQEETLERMLEWNAHNKPPLEDSVIEIKVESAFKPPRPYAYRFKKEKAKTKYSCGGASGNIAFEQANGEFIVYSKTTGEITKRKTVEGFKPFGRLVWKPVDDVLPYESERELWIEIKQYVWEHIDIPEGYDILTAWILASWVPERWHAVPYLFFYGPAGSGKTWALEVLASIGFRPFMTAATTLPVIFRVVDKWHPTLFLDETEAYMRKERSEIMHLLNAGYRKGFPATRVEDTRIGFEVRVYDCFGFKALAGTRQFVETLKSRCIIFNMSKATRKVKTKIDLKRAENIRKKLLAYRFKLLSEGAQEEMSDVVSGRLRELFNPLILVAPETARNSIISQAKKIEEIIEEEERTSDEALVFKAVYYVHQQTRERKISIGDIAKAVNEHLGIYEQINNLTVGWILSRLGFKKTLHKGKRAVYWNKELAKRLSRRYLAEEVKGELKRFIEKSETDETAEL